MDQRDYTLLEKWDTAEPGTLKGIKVGLGHA